LLKNNASQYVPVIAMNIITCLDDRIGRLAWIGRRFQVQTLAEVIFFAI